MQAYQQPLLTDADRAEAIVQVRPELSDDICLKIAEFLPMRDFIRLQAVSNTWHKALTAPSLPRQLLQEARSTLTTVHTRHALQGLIPTVAPFFREEVESRLARIDGAEIVARRACCANRLFMYLAIGGLVGGGILIAAGEHQHIPKEVTAGAVIMAIASLACLVSLFCNRIAERQGRILDQGGVPRPRSPSVSYNTGPGFYSGI